MPLSALQRYLHFLALRGLSATYITGNKSFLNGYTNAVIVVTPETALEYFSKFLDRKLNTRARYAGYLKCFLQFLGYDFGLTVKRPVSLPQPVAGSDVLRLKAAIMGHKTHKDSTFRDLMLVETAISTGLRRSELANLQPKHMNFEGHRLTVVGGKGNKDRAVPLLPDVVTGLSKLCAGKAPNDRVFGLRPRSLGLKLRDWAQKAGVDLHTHSFRHYFATRLVERGANIRAAQELMGHASLSTTQIYLAVTGRHLEDAINLIT